MTKEERSFYRSQAQKRLKLAYEYAREDIESGSFRDVYLLSGGIAKVEFILFFTEPEERMWHDIRAWQGDFCFFPEYPIGPDTVDFADPFRKVVIEVDSRYHSECSDSLKDGRLRQAGYKVIRV
ncbi:MAG: hypothetical protein QG623_648, partial [Patescibacteria group bacterium]|nr:hypothetical protein [Patescibacteria group bacterium]